MTHLATLEIQGDALKVVTTCPVVADHHWQQRRELVRLAGAQRLRLLVDLPGAERLELTWALGPLPASLPAPEAARRRRFLGFTHSNP